MVGNLLVRVISPAVIAASSIVAPLAFAPSASAACPDVEVVFARGTGEDPGVGPTGQAFIDQLQTRLGGRSLGVYPVNYPASNEWSTGADGIRDAGAHVLSMSGSCPQTKMVLGGYSQGAAVMGFVTSAQVPEGVDPTTVPKPLQPEVADHVSSVVLFGTPNLRAMNFLNEPAVTIGPLYQPKTLKLCAPEDPVCSDGLNFNAHTTSAYDGDMVIQGATYAADHLSTGAGSPSLVRSPHA